MSVSHRLRIIIFARDNYTCQYCGAKAPERRIEVDHRLPVSKGGRDTLENLVTACYSCNRGKSDLLILAPDELEYWEIVDERIEEADVDAYHLMLDGDPYLRAIYGELVI